MMQIQDDVLQDREVRLFPSHHISSVREAELRATAALLSVARAVSEFGKVLVSLAGGPGGRIAAYTEVPFKVGSGPNEKEIRPDGLIRVVRGKRDWKALIEVKVGDNPIEQDQFDAYHKLARDEGIDSLITVSNQAALPNGLPPVSVDRRRLRSVSVIHVSWERLLSEARVLSRRKEVADPDQSWMLEEWILYLADPTSRIIEPPQLGDGWTGVLRAAREANLSAMSTEMHEVVERWDAFLRKLGMRLRAKMGVDVHLIIPRAEKNDPASRLKRLHSEAMDSAELVGAFKIPDAVGVLSVAVLLPARSVRYAIQMRPPTEGRQRTRINWLAKQLKAEGIPPDLIIKIQWDKGRQRSQARLAEVLVNLEVLLRDINQQAIRPESVPREFTVERSIRVPKGRGRSTAPVLEGIAAGLEAFYRNVVEKLRPFVPRAPRLARVEDGQEEAAVRSSTEEKKTQDDLPREVVADESDEPAS